MSSANKIARNGQIIPFHNNKDIPYVSITIYRYMHHIPINITNMYETIDLLL